MQARDGAQVRHPVEIPFLMSRPDDRGAGIIPTALSFTSAQRPHQQQDCEAGEHNGRQSVDTSGETLAIPLQAYPAKHQTVAAINHAGIMLQPRALLTQELASGVLLEILPDALPAPRLVNMLYPAREPMPLLIDYLSDHRQELDIPA